MSGHVAFRDACCSEVLPPPVHSKEAYLNGGQDVRGVGTDVHAYLHKCPSFVLVNVLMFDGLYTSMQFYERLAGYMRAFLINCLNIQLCRTFMYCKCSACMCVLSTCSVALGMPTQHISSGSL